MTLTGEQVRAVRFQASKLREGYDQAQVDAFLDQVATAVDVAASGGVPGLSADDVLRVKFQATKFREGYDQDEVDDFLDNVVRALRGDVGDAAIPAVPLDAAVLREKVAALRPVRLRAGYDPQTVTAFLTDAAAELERRARGFRPTSSAQEVTQAQFPTTWLKPGFDRATVDALVRHVAASLRAGD